MNSISSHVSNEKFRKKKHSAHAFGQILAAEHWRPNISCQLEQAAENDPKREIIFLTPSKRSRVMSYSELAQFVRAAYLSDWPGNFAEQQDRSADIDRPTWIDGLL